MAHIRRHRVSGHWQVRYRDPDGMERAETFPRKADAEAYKDTVAAAVRSGEYVDPQLGKVPVSEFAEMWQATRSHLAQATRDQDRHYLNSLVLPTFGRRQVASVRRSEIEVWTRVVADQECVSECRLVRIHGIDRRNTMLDVWVPQDHCVHGLSQGRRQYRLSFVGVDRADSPGDISALDQLNHTELFAVVVRPLGCRFALLAGSGGNPDLMDVDQPWVGEAIVLDRQLSEEEPDELVEELVADRLASERSEASVDSSCVGIDLERLEVGVRRQREHVVATRADVEEAEAST